MKQTKPKTTHFSVLMPLCVLAMSWMFSICGQAQAVVISVTAQVDQTMGRNVPVHTAITLPRQLQGLGADQIQVSVYPADKPEQATVGQVLSTGDDQYELWWIVSDAQQTGQSWQARFSIGQTPAEEGFSWQGKPGDYLDLRFAGRPITRYMYASDTSTDRRAYETYKVYHHVFDRDGNDFITKGPGGLFTHHRGIYYGFNHLHYDGDRRNDWWHMSHGVRQKHHQFEPLIAGPVLARSTAVIHWNDAAGQPVVVERRTLTAYRQPEPTIALLDFESELTAARSDVRLAGDPEHAGVQYRAHNYVAEHTKDLTVYVFDDPDADAHRDRDMPWAAMRYYMQDRTPYTVQQMDHPTNPRGTLFSAYRDYGRFGAFFVTDVAQGDPLTVRYRFWIANTEMPGRETLRQQWNAFVR